MLIAHFYRIGEEKNEENSSEITWHVNQSLKQVEALSSRIHCVSADGHELEYIKNKFSNIPMADCRVVVWRGEIARFIAENL